MSEMITVEAVSNKFANKFSSGSVLAGGKWMQVAKDIDLSIFQKDTQVAVELKTNAKGYTSIVGVEETGNIAEEKETPKEAPKKRAKAETNTQPVAKTYEENKSRRILVQGVVQAVVQSPSLSGLPFTTTDDVVNNVKEVARQLIAFVDEEAN